MAVNKLTKEQIKEIIDLYNLGQGKTIKELSEAYKCSYVNIRMLLKRRGLINVNIKHRFHTNKNLDLDLFKNIDTEFKAYLLGLIAADGHVSKQNIEISLQKRDEDILQRIHRELNLSAPLRYKQPKANRQEVCRLFLCSVDLVNQLNNLGLRHNKTKTLSIDIIRNISDYLLRHFVRGFFDGDGCISKTKRGDYTLGIIGCITFIEPLKEILESKLGIHFSLTKHGTTPYIRTITVSGRYQCIKFGDWLYSDTNIYMERKYNKYIDLINSELENPYGKLAIKDYEVICNLYKTGKHTYVSLANLYDINRSHVARIIKGYRPLNRNVK